MTHVANMKIKRWLDVPNKVKRASGVTFYKRTNEPTNVRTDEQRVKATSETQNQAVPNTDTASTASAAGIISE